MFPRYLSVFLQLKCRKIKCYISLDKLSSKIPVSFGGVLVCNTGQKEDERSHVDHQSTRAVLHLEWKVAAINQPPHAQNQGRHKLSLSMTIVNEGQQLHTE